MTILNALLPLASILLGAGITYWLNVRQRRQSVVEDLFARAMAAAAAAEASVDYIGHISPWRGATDLEHADFLKEVGREATLNHIRKVAEAREALAQLIPFQQDLDRFHRAPPADFLQQIPELLSELRKGLRPPTRMRIDSECRGLDELPS